MDAIEIENVTKKFKERGKKFYALKDVSFSIKKGELFGLLGPNGSGKTTLLNIIINVTLPDSGRVRIFGKDVQKNTDLLEQINFVAGEARFHWALTAENILNFYGMIYKLDRKKRERRIRILVKELGVEYLLKRRFYTLSTGERMRVMLLRALINKPKIILMDEPTLGLDPSIAIQVRKQIKKLNRKFKTTILLTSHYMNEVEELADRIAFINKGSVVDVGEVEKVKSRKFESYEVIATLSKVRDTAFLKSRGFKVRGNKISKTLTTDQNISDILSTLEAKKFEIINIETRKPTLEDYFVKILKKGGEK